MEEECHSHHYWTPTIYRKMAPRANHPFSTTNASSMPPYHHHHQHHDLSYYAKCLLAGASASSIRWVQNPLDVVKCNMQVDPNKYTNLWSGLRMLWIEEGMAGWFRGIGPTAVAYAIQTGTKYGLYEVFKDQLTETVGREQAFQYRSLIYIAAAGSAEAVADVLMCPWEMIKVKQQISPVGAFPNQLGQALSVMMSQRSQLKFPFGSLVPIWGRQVPATIANFLAFENIVEAFYTHVLTEPKTSYSQTTQLAVSFTAGYLAGFVSAIVSHPADSLISLQAKPENANKSLRQVASETSFFTLATKGLGPRIIMVGSIISFQWLLYDGFRSMMGLGTTGGQITR